MSELNANNDPNTPAENTPEPSSVEEVRQSILARSQFRRESLNPFFSWDVAANLRDEVAAGRATQEKNAFGQPVVTSEALNMTTFDLEAILQSNVEQNHSLDPNVQQKIFNLPNWVADAESIVLRSYGGVCSVYVKDATPSFSHLIGPPLQCATVRLVVAQGKQWSNGQLADMMQPLRASKHGVLIPLVGSIYAAGENLINPDVENSLPIAASAFPGKDFDRSKPADPALNDIVMGSYPMYLHGGRSVILPAALPIPVIRHPAGGYEVLSSMEQFNEYTTDRALAEEKGFTILKSVVTQYIGVGIRRYVYHAKNVATDGKVDLNSDEVIINTKAQEKLAGGSVTIVQDTRYAGERGVFLDVRHQPDTDAPTGGLTTAQYAIDLDRRLFAHGAKLGGITLGSTVLTTKAAVDALLGSDSGMINESIEVAYRAIFDDTLRLDALIGKNHDSTEPSPPFKEFIQRDYGTYTDKNRDAYLAELHRTVAHNLAICFSLDLTVRPYQPTDDNLSIYGKILDSENFEKMDAPYDFIHLARSWVENLQDVAEAGGITASEYLASELFHSFCAQLLSPESMELFTESLSSDVIATYGILAVANELNTHFIVDRLREASQGFALQELLNEVAKNGAYGRMVKNRSDTLLRNIIASLQRGETPLMYDEYLGRMIPEAEIREETRRVLELDYVQFQVMFRNPKLKWDPEDRASLPLLKPTKLSTLNDGNGRRAAKHPTTATATVEKSPIEDVTEKTQEKPDTKKTMSPATKRARKKARDKARKQKRKKR